MPYKHGEFPPSYKNIDPATRVKAVAMLNAMLAKGMKEDEAIPMALKRARGHDEMRLVELAHGNAIRGVEIFSPGKHNGEDYTEQDVDDIVAASAKLDFRPAIKVGHTKDAPGAPAYGYVENLRKESGKPVADLTDMHDSVVDAIRTKAYDRLSSEIYLNLNRGGQKFRRALKAVALLGAEVPAVANLKPLHKMEFVAEGAYASLTHADHELDVPTKALLDAMGERLQSLTELQTEQKELNDMDIKELKGKIKELSEQITALKGSDAKDKDEKIAKLAEQVTAISAELAKIEAPADAELKRQLAEEKAAREADRTRIATLEAAARARDVAERTAKLTVPAMKDAVQALYTYALEHADAKVKVFTVDKDKKRVEVEKDLAGIVDGFVAVINDQARKLFTQLATQEHRMRDEGESEDKASDEVTRLAKKYMHDHPTVKKFSEASELVLQENPGLARRYAEELGAKATTGATTH